MSYLNDYEEFPEIKYCPFCGGEVETGHIDLPIEGQGFYSIMESLSGGGLLKTRWYADKKSASPEVVCFAATGRKRTLAAYCESCQKVTAVLEVARADGAML